MRHTSYLVVAALLITSHAYAQQPAFYPLAFDETEDDPGSSQAGRDFR